MECIMSMSVYRKTIERPTRVRLHTPKSLPIKHISLMPLFDHADKMVQISRAHYGGNTNVNNTWVK